MEFIDTCKHFGNVESSMFLLEYAGVIQERAEVTAWDIFHRKVDMLSVLEGI